MYKTEMARKEGQQEDMKQFQSLSNNRRNNTEKSNAKRTQTKLKGVFHG
jgi:hypothetical protein